MSNEKTDIYAYALAEARSTIKRVQKSPNYRSFFTVAAIEAFAEIEGSVLAGKSLPSQKSLD